MDQQNTKNFFQTQIDQLINLFKTEISVLKKTFQAAKILTMQSSVQKNNLDQLSQHFDQGEKEIDQATKKLDDDLASLKEELSTVKYPFSKK